MKTKGSNFCCFKVIAVYLFCYFLTGISPVSVSAYDFKYISGNAQKKQFLVAYGQFAQYRENYNKKRYNSALESLTRLSLTSDKMELFAHVKMSELLIAQFSPDAILKAVSNKREKFKRILFRKYIRKFLNLIAKGEISKKTAAKFYAEFNFTESRELKKILIYLYKEGSIEFKTALKAAWLDNKLPVAYKKNKTIFYHPKSLKELEKKATYSDWLKRYTRKYKDKEYRNIINKIEPIARRFETANFYPHDMYYLYYKSLYNKRRLSKFLQKLSGKNLTLMLDKHKDIGLYVMNAYLRLEQYKNANYFLRGFEKSVGNEKHVNTLKFKIGQHYFKNDPEKFNEILRIFDQIDVGHLDEKDYDDMKWYLLNIKLSQTNKPRLINDIKALWENTNNNTYASGYCYWTKKILHSQNRLESNSSYCANLYTNYYYGIKSVVFEKPGQLFTECKKSDLEKLRTSDDNFFLEWYRILNNIYGFDGVKLLLENSKDSISLYSLSIMVNELEKKELYYHAQEILSRHYKNWWNTSWPKSIQSCGFFYKIAYPKAYINIVKKYAKKYGVSVYLILSIMREESSFNPKAVSSSKAIGLMQLIKPTAKFVAAKTRVKYSRKKLYTTDYNIRFGTYYISNLLSRFSKNNVYSLAAYNGGPTNVKRWIKENGSYDEDIFIELIPFRETRNYVKKVTRTYHLYNQIY